MCYVDKFSLIVDVLPLVMTSNPLYRMTILFFGLCGLDILQSVDTVSAEERKQLREWIYAQQILPDKTGVHTSSTTCD